LLLKKYGGYSVTRNPPNPSQRLGCQYEFFIICIYFDLLFTSLCDELSMPLLVTLSKPFHPHQKYTKGLFTKYSQFDVFLVEVGASKPRPEHFLIYFIQPYYLTASVCLCFTDFFRILNHNFFAFSKLCSNSARFNFIISFLIFIDLVPIQFFVC